MKRKRRSTGPARPCQIPGGVVIRVVVTPEQREAARRIGGGNISEGVRRRLTFDV